MNCMACELYVNNAVIKKYEVVIPLPKPGHIP